MPVHRGHAAHAGAEFLTLLLPDAVMPVPNAGMSKHCFCHRRLPVNLSGRFILLLRTRRAEGAAVLQHVNIETMLLCKYWSRAEQLLQCCMLLALHSEDHQVSHVMGTSPQELRLSNEAPVHTEQLARQPCYKAEAFLVGHIPTCAYRLVDSVCTLS